MRGGDSNGRPREGAAESARYHGGRGAFTMEKILEAIERPYQDREPLLDAGYEYLLTVVSEDREG